jgi:hypothetical protein
MDWEDCWGPPALWAAPPIGYCVFTLPTWKPGANGAAAIRLVGAGCQVTSTLSLCESVSGVALVVSKAGSSTPRFPATHLSHTLPEVPTALNEYLVKCLPTVSPPGRVRFHSVATREPVGASLAGLF